LKIQPKLKKIEEITINQVGKQIKREKAKQKYEINN
jgi:hypothetical protein